MSDNGSQFQNSFDTCCGDLGITHSTLSAYFALSNGAIERSLKYQKLFMYKMDMERKGMLEDAVDLLNNTPCTAEGLSLSRLYHGRLVLCPRLSLLIADNTEESDAAQSKAVEREWRKQVKNDHLSIFRRKPLELVSGDTVRMQSVKSGL